ncbi:MgtC/SapB family protein [Gaoshiqia sp. Z1-71]|uniref:MgtC/SapB family protein n=1 Tax=Gaoshiqia hydrogeniformans TaxID=3290090 RepID=UPI003BF821BB
MDIQQYVPGEIVNFFLVLVFSLLIGMGQRRHHLNHDENVLFGTDRTFTFIGLLGYVLYLADPHNLVPFLTGFFIIGLLLAVQYFQKIRKLQDYGLTTSILALLTYCLTVMVFTQPAWLTLSFVVSLLILTEMKSHFKTISMKASDEEFITLGKFIAFAGIILPLLPAENMADFIPISPYELWLAIVVVSGISYISYLLKKFVFPGSGVLLTGILGGIYSSTTTTLILARREKEEGTTALSVAAIMLANGMMYLRILALAYLFNRSIGQMLTIPFLLMFGIAFGLSKWIGRDIRLGKEQPVEEDKLVKRNPLELKMASVFGLLFVVFGLVTEMVMKHYGSSGVSGMAFLIGVFDIDPFLLYLLQQHSGIVQLSVALAVINATNSNNLMKMIYAMSLGSKQARKPLLSSFLILFFSGLLVSLIFYLIYR